jgi:hypothetical protein
LDSAKLDQEKLFFIIGHGRSGTDLLQSIMCTFSGFCNDRESRVGEEKISCYRNIILNNDFENLEGYINKNWTKEFFVEKTPNSIFCLPQLNFKYPNANYIFLERNPLKIILSRMNVHQPGTKENRFRKRQLLQGNISSGDLNLNYEQLHAKLVLKGITEQIKNKPSFKNQITIRYEDLISNLENSIFSIQSKFRISSNIDLAKEKISKPSRSSKNNTYEIKHLTDNKAIEWIKEACVLWNYEPG